jgi:hypothetical protein
MYREERCQILCLHPGSWRFGTNTCKSKAPRNAASYRTGCRCGRSLRFRVRPINGYSTQPTWMRPWRGDASCRRLPRIGRGARVPRNANRISWRVAEVRGGRAYPILRSSGKSVCCGPLPPHGKSPLASRSHTAKPEGARAVGADATAHPSLATSGPDLPSLSFTGVLRGL